MPTSFKFILTGILLVVIGWFWGADDLRLMISGRKTTATITDVSDSNNGRQIVNFAFSDESGSNRNGSCVRESGWVPPADLKLPLLYFHDHPETARVAADIGFTGLWISLLGIALIAGGCWYYKRAPKVKPQQGQLSD